MKSSWIALAFVSLTQFSKKWTPKLWGWLYNTLAAGDQTGKLLFMNYGYAEKAAPSSLKLEADDEPFRYPIQLYHHVTSGVALQGRDISEVGCGRGGGGSFLTRTMHPQSYTGIDLSEKAIAWCRKTLLLPQAKWVQGSADALPLADKSVDVIVNVESSHCYPSMGDFLKEVYRALRPGGHFVMCDLRTKQGVEELDRALQASGLILEQRRVITPQVLHALDLVSAERRQAINVKVPRLLQGAFSDFAGLQDTTVYTMLAEGKMEYLSYQLKKPAA